MHERAKKILPRAGYAILIIKLTWPEEMGIQNLDNQSSRNSEDRKANPRGSKLLDVCKLNDFLILNGRTTGDLFGSFTSHQWNGSSVVDYALTSNIFTKNILEFRVGNFVPWLSDHCPLHITICINKPLVRNVSIEEAMTDLCGTRTLKMHLRKASRRF